MGDFRLWLEASWEKETVVFNGREDTVKNHVEDILSKKLQGKALRRAVNKIAQNQIVRKRDPKVAIPLATWLLQEEIHEIDEHDYDWQQYYDLKKMFRYLTTRQKYPDDLIKYQQQIESLLKSRPTDFVESYGLLQRLVQPLSRFIGTSKDRKEILSHLNVQNQIAGPDGKYVMYKIDDKEEAEEVQKEPSPPTWCVLRGFFGRYDGPPYMPIVYWPRGGGFPSYIAMFIPGHIHDEPDQGLRNASNTGMVDLEEIRRIKPLLEPFLDVNKLSKSVLDRVFTTYRGVNIEMLEGVAELWGVEDLTKTSLDQINCWRLIRDSLKEGSKSKVERVSKVLRIPVEGILDLALSGPLDDLDPQSLPKLFSLYTIKQEHINALSEEAFRRASKAGASGKVSRVETEFGLMNELGKLTNLKLSDLGPGAQKLLILAVKNEMLGALQGLLHGGLNPNYQTKGKQMTALHYALLLGHPKVRDPMIRLLLQAGARTDLKDKQGMTPIDYAKYAAEMGDQSPLRIIQSTGRK